MVGMTDISSSAESARESARTAGGQFGTQTHSEPDITLPGTAPTPARTVAQVAASIARRWEKEGYTEDEVEDIADAVQEGIATYAAQHQTVFIAQSASGEVMDVFWDADKASDEYQEGYVILGGRVRNSADDAPETSPAATAGTIRTPAELAEDRFLEHDIESVRESSTEEVLLMIAEAVEADRRQHKNWVPTVAQDKAVAQVIDGMGIDWAVYQPDREQMEGALREMARLMSA